ncbi:hypothetical protein NE237_009396 [Protea cynaroides]|uniref:Protein SCAR n=1 Tax=Protea cynaroides TaxID=273540 RepID=A0A9Q0KYA0_9MAGN|nr:hypothetical protein NE237_009396 [Protea cynaroides]
MPLTRYQTRNEYSLADPELYRAANKDDPEALLEGVAMAGLVGVLRQLGDLAEFAAEIFHDLHEEVMTAAARGHGLMLRVQQLEAEVPSIERDFLSRTSHSVLLCNAGVEWHPNLRMDQNMITRGDLPRCVMDSYEECRGPPRLFLLDKFDIAGAGACLKRYSDPSFFKAEFTSSETMGSDVQRAKKARKIKKKGSRWKNGENPDGLPPSHAKLHQLLSNELNYDNDALVNHVKLKKRQLNGFPLESTTGKSYMERFVEAHSPESKILDENSSVLPHLNMDSSNTSELGLEIREIGTASPANKLLQGERGLDSSAERHETALEQSMYKLHDNIIKKGILEKLPEPICDIEVEKVPSSLDKLEDQKELLVDVESNKEAIVDGYQSDDITSEVDNYMDALASMESEMETDTETGLNNARGFFNTKSLGMDSDTNEEQQKHGAYFSESPSFGNSTESDDENNLFSKGRHNPSNVGTLSNLAVKGPSGGDAVAKVATSAVTFPAEVVDVSSEKPSANGNTLVPGCLEYIVPGGSGNEVSVIPSYDSELVEASPNSCVTDSTSTISHSSPVANLKDGPLAGEFVKRLQVEIMNGLTHYEVSSDALLHQPDISVLAIEGKYADDTLEVVPPTKCAEGQDLEVCSNAKLPECLLVTTSADDLDNLKPDTTLESDIGIQTTREDPEYLTSALGIQKPSVSAERGLSEMTEKVPPFQPDLGEGSRNFGVKTLYNNLEVFSNKPTSGVNEEPLVDVVQLNSCGSVGKSASIYSAPESSKPALMTDCYSQMDNLAGTVHAEADGEDTVVCQRLIGSPSKNHVKLEDEYPSSNGNVSDIENKVNSKLDNLVSGAACADDADTADSLNRIGSPSQIPIKSLEECLSDAGSEHCKVETNQACHSSGIELDFPWQGPNTAQANLEAPVLPPLPPLGWRVEKLQHSSPTSEREMVQPSLNPILPPHFTPLGREIVQPLHPFLPLNSTGDLKHQYGAKVSGGDMLHHLNQSIDDANNKQGFQTSGIEETQTSNPFLPLPTTDTEDEKHGHYSLTIREEKANPGLNSFVPPPATEEVRPASDTSQGESSDIQTLSVLKLNKNDGMLQPPIIKEEEPLNSFVSTTIKDEQALNAFASLTIKDEEPLNAFVPPTLKDEEPSLNSLTLEGEIPSNASTLLPEAEAGVTNGKPPRKIPRPRDPLIEAVASHDRSTMRKVTERILPEMLQKMDKRDSLLEQIRTKSFSLKPTLRPMVTTRFNIHGPRTNLKVAAILEKANTIRQATAGSDEDDDDDSWSDS